MNSFQSIPQVLRLTHRFCLSRFYHSKTWATSLRCPSHLARPAKARLNLVRHLDLDAQFVIKGKDQAQVLLEYSSHGHDVDAILDALPCHLALLNTQ